MSYGARYLRIYGSGLNYCQAIFGLDSENLAHPRHLNYHAVVKRQRATGKSSTPAARSKRDPLTWEHAHDLCGFFCGRRKNHGSRPELVLRQAVAFINKQFVRLAANSFAAHNRPQVVDEFVHVFPHLELSNDTLRG